MSERNERRLVGFGRTRPGAEAGVLQEVRKRLVDAGCEDGLIFLAEHTAAGLKNPSLDAALKSLKPGDGLVLGLLQHGPGSVEDVLALAEILKGRGSYLLIPSLGIDTSNVEELSRLAILAETVSLQRELYLEKQRLGIEQAKAEGKYKGRAPTAQQKRSQILKLKDAGRTVSQIVSELSISRASVYRVLRSGEKAD